jgi:hypothetical protein
MIHIPKIIIRTIDHGNQRFGEVGDWFFDAEEKELTVFVSRMTDWRSELSVAIHEAFEAVACIAKDIDQTDVDAFDKEFYLNNDEGEAGDDKDAPYHVEHVSATFIEREVTSRLGLPWQQHERIIDDV